MTSQRIHTNGMHGYVQSLQKILDSTGSQKLLNIVENIRNTSMGQIDF